MSNSTIKANIKGDITEGKQTLVIKCSNPEYFYDIIKAVNKVLPVSKVKADSLFCNQYLKEKLATKGIKLKYERRPKIVEEKHV